MRYMNFRRLIPAPRAFDSFLSKGRCYNSLIMRMATLVSPMRILAGVNADRYKTVAHQDISKA